MAINLFSEINKEIFYKRQQGYSPFDILKYMQSIEPCLDELLLLNHVARVLKEKGMPFSQKQIKKVFNRIYVLSYHGDKAQAWTFLKSFCSKKLIVFKSEKAHPISNVPSLPLKEIQRSLVINDLTQNHVELIETKKSEVYA